MMFRLVKALAIGSMAFSIQAALAADPPKMAKGLLVDAAGRTLYTFDNESGGGSACSGGCAVAWPPALATAAALSVGDFSTIARGSLTPMQFNSRRSAAGSRRDDDPLAQRKIQMQQRNAKVLLHLAGPTIGNDVRRLMGELAALAGVARVVPGSKVSRLLLIDYDPTVTGVRTLLACARRGWTAARAVGI